MISAPLREHSPDPEFLVAAVYTVTHASADIK